MRLIHKIILILILFPSLALASQDIVLPNISIPQFLIGRGLTANASGSGGFNNNFIMTVPSGWPYLCVQVSSQAGFSMKYSLSAYSAIDPATSTFTGNPYAWSPLPVQGDSPVPFTSTTGGGWQVVGGYPSTNIIGLTSSGVIDLSFSQADNGSYSGAINILGSLSSTGVCGKSNWNIAKYWYEAPVTTTGQVLLIGPTNSFYFVNNTDNFVGCQVSFEGNNTAGTTPTENVYLGSYGFGFNDDRISFTQFTTGDVKRSISFSAASNTTDHQIAFGSLAAGTTMPGIFNDGMILKWVLGGTTPAYTNAIEVDCYR